MSVNITINPTKNAWMVDIQMNPLPPSLQALPDAFVAIRDELLLNDFLEINYGKLKIYKPKDLKNAFLVQPEIQFRFSTMSEADLIETFTRLAEKTDAKPDNIVHYGMMAATAISSYAVAVSDNELMIRLVDDGADIKDITDTKTGTRELQINIGAFLLAPDKFYLTM